MGRDSEQFGAKSRSQVRMRERGERSREEQEHLERQFIAENYELLCGVEQCMNIWYTDIPMVPSPPLEWADEPHFALPGEWLGMTSITPAMMSRHWMVLGETGSGKTKSVVLPLLNSLLEYELETQAVVNKEVTHG